MPVPSANFPFSQKNIYWIFINLVSPFVCISLTLIISAEIFNFPLSMISFYIFTFCLLITFLYFLMIFSEDGFAVHDVV